MPNREIEAFILKNHQPHPWAQHTAVEHTLKAGPNTEEHHLTIRGKMTRDQVKVLNGLLMDAESRREIKDRKIENPYSLRGGKSDEVIEYGLTFSAKGTPEEMKVRANHIRDIAEYVLNQSRA